MFTVYHGECFAVLPLSHWLNELLTKPLEKGKRREPSGHLRSHVLLSPIVVKVLQRLSNSSPPCTGNNLPFLLKAIRNLFYHMPELLNPEN